MRIPDKLVFESLVQVRVHTPAPTEIISGDDYWNNFLDRLEIIRYISGAKPVDSIEELIDAFCLYQFLLQIMFDLLIIAGMPIRRGAGRKLSFDKHCRIATDND